MIYDKLVHAEQYRSIPGLGEILRYLEALGDQLPEEKVELEGEKVFVNPVRFTSKPEEKCKYEAHQKYADVHYVFKGREKILVQDIQSVRPLGAFDELHDIGFYEAEKGVELVLEAGDFLVCFPQDAHKVGIAPDAPAPIEKLVGKIRMIP